MSEKEPLECGKMHMTRKLCKILLENLMKQSNCCCMKIFSTQVNTIGYATVTEPLPLTFKPYSLAYSDTLLTNINNMTRKSFE